MSGKLFETLEKVNFFNKVKDKASGIGLASDNNNVVEQAIEEVKDNKHDASWVAWPKSF